LQTNDITEHDRKILRRVRTALNTRLTVSVPAQNTRNIFFYSDTLHNSNAETRSTVNVTHPMRDFRQEMNTNYTTHTQTYLPVTTAKEAA
jgi:sulfur relay (sulfurtransferase) complex TusBCD TusD component (DsrE family)